jgi:hypothetical protein
MRFISWLGQQRRGLCHRIQLDCRTKKIEYVLVKTFNQYNVSLTNVVFFKNLVGKQFGKDENERPY